MTDRIQYPKPNKTYRYYKGGLYKVITLAKHSGTFVSSCGERFTEE
jgi:hypothetical protein